MARNGTGTYVLPAGQPVVTNTSISSTTFNTLTSDIATALTQSVCTDGQTPMAAILSMGNYKITNLATGTLGTDAVNKTQMDAADAVVTAAYLGTYSGRNLIDNGQMRIAARGTTYALTVTTTFGSIDRWGASMGATAAGIWNRVAAPAQSRFEYVGKLGRTAASSSAGQLTIAQALETTTSLQAAGKTVILSFYAYAGANYSSSASGLTVVLRYGTGSDQSTASLAANTWTGTTDAISQTATLTTTITRFTYTAVIPATATQLGLIFAYIPTGTAGADDNVYITGVQLEVGITGQTSASSFEFLPYPMDEIRCKRYYQRVNFTVAGYNSAGGNITAGGALPVSMRNNPTPAQVTNNYTITSSNITGTTSTYLVTDNNSAYAYRAATALGAAQFSELASLTSDL